MKDEALIALFWERNEDAVTETKSVYGAYCALIAQNLLRDARDTEECVNDVMFAAWNSIPPQRPASLKTYLGRLTRNRAVDRLRQKNAQKRAGETLPLDELEELIGKSDVEEAMQGQELARLLSAFLRSLKEDERNIFIRRYWFFDSVKSICARYGFGQSKVLVSLARTREKLAEYLRKEGYLR